MSDDPRSRSRTAQGVLAERALLDHLGVVDDPYAHGMLDPALRRLVDTLRRLPPGTWRRAVTLAGLAARVVWTDREVTSAIDDGIDQVVVVGAGYDSRAWRMDRPGVRWFELDHRASQAAKRSVAPGPGPTWVEADLRTEDALDVLRSDGLATDRPTLFVVEGVTMYLDEAVLRRQLEGLAAGAATGSRLVADFQPPAATTAGRTRRQLWLQRVARGGSGERFRLTLLPDEAGALLAATGWDVTERTSLRDAAMELVPADSQLPRSSVNPDKTLVAARLRRR